MKWSTKKDSNTQVWDTWQISSTEKKLFEIVYSPKLICGNCRIARLVDRDLLFTVAARLINSPTTQTLETKPIGKLKKPMPKLYARIRPKKEAKIYVQRSKRRMKNAMKQTLWDVNNKQQSTFFITITSRHATTSISPNLGQTHLFAIQKRFQTSWVLIYMSFFRLQKSVAEAHPYPPLPGSHHLNPPVAACANARWRRKASRVEPAKFRMIDENFRWYHLFMSLSEKNNPAVNGMECHLDDLLAK